ncbi:MAG: carbohydrate binding domain-containing protein, partial [Armatimonadota bacterium]
MSRIGISLLTLLLVSTCLAQPLKEWVLPNPGFEQALQGWSLVKAANASSDATVSRTGVASLKLSAEDQFHPYVAQGVKNLQGGATYALRAWARGTQGTQATVALKIEYYNAKGENTKGQYSDSIVLKSDEWQQITLEPVADPDTVRASLLLRLMSAGEVWFDDVTFAMTREPAAVTLNPARVALAAGKPATVNAAVRLREPWDKQPPQVTVTGESGGTIAGASALV